MRRILATIRGTLSKTRGQQQNEEQQTHLIRRFALLSILLLGVSTFGFSCSRSVQPPSGRTLDLWIVFDETSDFSEIKGAYETQFPYVRINVSKFTMAEYEQKLLEGWALGEGPDIFAIPNTYVHRFEEFIAPAPDSTQSFLVETEGRSTVVTEQQTAMLTEVDVGRFFMDAVQGDVVIDGKVMGLPLAFDTLGLYFNKTLLSQAGIPLPAATWQEVVDHTSSIALQDSQGNIVRSGIALGTTDNVPRFSDIVSVLMLQNGANMTVPDESRVAFTGESEETPGYFPGRAAVDFFTDFARSSKEVYSWNEAQPNALEEFIAGNLAYYVGYSYDYEEISSRAPGLSFDVTNFPQVSTVGRTDFGNYWVFSVASASEFQNDAWDFLNFMAGSAQVQGYLEGTGQPTALKSLVDNQAQDPVIGLFARQGLTAQTWYHGEDPDSMEAAIKEMIDLINDGSLSTDEALNNAAQKIDLTL